MAQKVTITTGLGFNWDLDQNGFPVFTQKNIAFVNSLISNDSNYSKVNDPTSPKYADSYAKLLLDIKSSRQRINSVTRDVIYKIVKSIDTTDSTHLSSMGRTGENYGIDRTVDEIMRIMAKPAPSDLETRFKNKDATLVSDIALAATNLRNNFSFASKFCTYISQYLYNGDFCKYDKVVQEILPYYAYMYIDSNDVECTKYYRINKKRRKESIVESEFKNKNNYDGYRKYIDKIIAGIKIQSNIATTYAQFDSILWYYFKGRDYRINNAMSCIK